MKHAKSLLWLLIVVPILALIIALCCGAPVLDWVALVLNGIGKAFCWVGWLCGWLQGLIGR